MHKRYFFPLILLVVTFAHAQPADTINSRFYGNWVNTSLFDSTRIQQKLAPWIHEFYGAAALNLTRDSIQFVGSMDGGRVDRVHMINANKFTSLDLADEPIFEYLPDRDLVKLTSKSGFLNVIFRRVMPSDRLDIITDEEKFQSYFISLFFDKYLKVDKRLRIDKLWVGFYTYTPFDSDVFGVKGRNQDIHYYSWELTRNSLRIFKTKRKLDSDSGFYFWTRGELEREIFLK